MTPAKHTPGPWVWVGGADKRLAPFIRSKAVMVSVGPDRREAVAQVMRSNYAEYEANARLIAAAPDLLNALKAILGSLDVTISNNQVLEQARAAVAKAEGSA